MLANKFSPLQIEIITFISLKINSRYNHGFPRFNLFNFSDISGFEIFEGFGCFKDPRSKSFLPRSF